MKQFLKHLIISIIVLLGIALHIKAQSPKVKGSVFEGIIIGGYVDNGFYANCTGPSVKFSHKPFTVIAGLLPTLRIKEDKSSTTQNATVTPTLGFGLTASYKHLALQLPFFYNSKTNAQNGSWKAGIGVGYKF